MHGAGTYTYPDDRVYEGYFQFGERTGFGTYTWSNGNKYEGEWVKGMQNGNGKYTKNGQTRKGIWVDGKRT